MDAPLTSGFQAVPSKTAPAVRGSIAASNRGNLRRGVRSFSCAVIKDINARQILDSRGNPTVEVHVEEMLTSLE